MIMFRKAVLVIHGFAGGTYDEEPLIHMLERHWKLDVYSFTLPGHQKRDSESNHEKEWIEESEKMLKKLRKFGYKDIYLVGHSMGGVIATYLSTKYKYVKKLVLVAPAFNYLVNSDEKDTFNMIKKGILAAKEVDKGELFTRFMKIPLSAIKEFTNLINDYKDTIYKVNVPILIIQGKKDTLVPFESSEELINKVQSKNKKLVFLDNTTHDVFKDEESDKAIKKIERFLLK